MKIIFSRKGFDSSAGGKPSRVIDGRPVSLPIPTIKRSKTTFGHLGLGDIVSAVTKSRISADDLCHYDPMFQDGYCAFGQTGAAQKHLHNQKVGEDDVFIFFGLFANRDGRDRHHRIFGYLQIDEIVALGANPEKPQCLNHFTHEHPHVIGEWNENNTLYFGRGALAHSAPDSLRLSKSGAAVSRWRIPFWLKSGELSYHSNCERWATEGELQVVARGQEFVTDVGEALAPRAWLDGIIATIHGS